MEIGVDFDGTCVTHEYPLVGKDIGAIPVLKALVNKGHRLILVTMRSTFKGLSPVTNTIEEGGLDDAVNWFKENDIPLYGIQTNPTQRVWTDSPKAYCHLYIDDVALGCPILFDGNISARPYVNWVEIEYILRQKGIL